MTPSDFEKIVKELREHKIKVGDWRDQDELIEETHDAKIYKGYIEVQDLNIYDLVMVFGKDFIEHGCVSIVPNNESYIQLNILHEVMK